MLEVTETVGQPIDRRPAFAELLRIVEVVEVASGETRVGIERRSTSVSGERLVRR